MIIVSPIFQLKYLKKKIQRALSHSTQIHILYMHISTQPFVTNNRTFDNNHQVGHLTTAIALLVTAESGTNVVGTASR